MNIFSRKLALIALLLLISPFSLILLLSSDIEYSEISSEVQNQIIEQIKDEDDSIQDTLADSANVDLIKAESSGDKLEIVSESDTLDIKTEEPFHQKEFRGTHVDVIIAAGVIVVWLIFMWVAGNQGPN